MATPQISACIVVYNEDAVIGRCLESLAETVDEIIVVHDGQCTDRTLEIARQFTSKVFERPHIGIAEGHRIFCFEQATGNWILQIDADEYLSPELRQHLRELAASGQAEGYAAIWPIWENGQAVSQSWPHKPCFFLKKDISYLDFPQEPLRTLGRLINIPYILEHRPLGERSSWSYFKTNSLKRARIQAQAFCQDFADIPKYNITSTDWPPPIRFALHYPWLFALFGLYVFEVNLAGGAWKSGWRAVRSAYYWGLYNAAVYYYYWHLYDTRPKNSR